MSRARKSVLWRLSAGLIGALALLGITTAVLSVYLSSRASDQAEQLLDWFLAPQLARELEPVLNSGGGYYAAQEVVEKFLTLNPNIDVYILDPDGRLDGAFRSTEGLYRDRIPVAPIERFLRATPYEQAPLYAADPRGRHTEVIFSAAPLTVAGKPAYLYIVLVNDEHRKLLTVFQTRSLTRGVVVMVLFSVLVVSAVGLLLFSYLTKRLRRILAVVRDIEAGDLQKRTGVSGDDELGVLGRTIDSMAASLAANITELERRDMLRRELISDISHDLRSPAAVISCYAETILDDGERLAEKDRKRCETILSNATLLTKMLAELFELAKLEAREVKPRMEPFIVEDLAEEVVASYRRAAAKKGLSLAVESAATSTCAVGDAALLDRVFRNLVENALRHTPSGGVIRVVVREKEDTIRIEVRDSGVGIAAEDLPRVVERFYQGKETGGTKKGQGGLGLAIVRKIIEAHESRVELESEAEVGTTFAFELGRVSDA